MLKSEVAKLNQSISNTRALLKLRDFLGKNHPKMMDEVRAAEEKHLPARMQTKHRILKSWDQLTRLLAKNGEEIAEVVHEEERDVILTTSDNS